MNLEAGFLGGIVSGFLAGYIALWIRDGVKVPQHFEGLKPVLIIPLLSTLAVGPPDDLCGRRPGEGHHGRADRTSSRAWARPMRSSSG